MGKVFDLNGKDLTKTDTTLRVPEEPADAAEVGKRNDAQTESLKAEKSRAEGAEKKLQQQVDTLNAGGLNLKEELIRTQVDSYLTQHPEAMGTALAEETERAKGVENQIKEDIRAQSTRTENIFDSLKFINQPVYDYSGSEVTNPSWLLSNAVSIYDYKYLSVRLIQNTSVSPVVFFSDVMNVEHIVQRSEFYKIESDGYGSCYGFIEIPSTARYVKFATYDAYKVHGMVKFYKEIPNEIVVSHSNDGDVFTINSAKNLFPEGSNVNIYIKNGVYNEVVKFDNKYSSVTLIGENRDFCVIQDGTGVYINSPVVINGNFIIKNLTMKATLDNIGSWTPTYNDSNVVNTYPSYALHIDGHGYSDTAQAYGLIENCVIYSEAFPSVGMGVNKNQTVEFNNCVIERNCTNLAFRNANWAGAFYCHNAVDAGAYNQFLILKNNSIKCNYGYSSHIKCTVGATLESGFYFELEATNNNLYSKDVEYSGCKYERGQSSISGLSHGNSNNTLNTLVTSDTPTKFSNIFNENIATNKGSLQSGEIKPSTGWRVTDYLKPNLGGTIEYRAETVNGAISLAEFYDENHNEITEYRLAPVNGMSGGKYTIPNDDRIKYVRYCMSVNNEQFSGTTYINADLYLAKEK